MRSRPASDEEKDWPGLERDWAARWELYYYHTLTCSSGLAGGPGQAAAGQVARQGRAPVVQSSAQPVWAPADFPGTGHWHSYRSLRLLLGHRIGFTQVSSPCSSFLPYQKNCHKEIKFMTSSWHKLSGILVRHRHLVTTNSDGRPEQVTTVTLMCEQLVA